jgi:hypothetical protein
MRFHTGLFALDYFRYPKFPYRGNGWEISLLGPSKLPSTTSTHYRGRDYPGKEVLIHAPSKEHAQKAADLIKSALLTIDGSSLRSHTYPGEHAPITLQDAGSGEPFDPKPNSSVRMATMEIPLACLIAARASMRLRLVYALSKLALSFEIFSVPLMELDPERHFANIPKSSFPEDHVRYSFAIVTAWSCIEELGFEIRASQSNPTKIKGAWNPTVKSDLEARLRKGHIELKERCLWNLRGPRTRIELRRAPEIVKAAEWVRHLVRDGEIEVIDAINYVSFLRSKLSAHRLDHDVVKLLSVYDVANAQFVARRLLLETMGFWRYSESGLRRGK